MSEQLVELIETWRDDPICFVQDMFNVSPSKQQCLVLSAAAKPGARIAVKSGHGTGKSAVLSWLIIWGMVCFEETKIPCTAPTGHQLRDVLLAEVSKWKNDMLNPWKDMITVARDSVNFEGFQSFAAMRTGRKENPEALQGFHARDLLFLIDEASAIDEKVYEAARGALSTPSARIVMVSNPTRSTGYFYNAFHRSRDLWQLFTFSCLEAPEFMVDPNYIKEMRDEYGEDSDIFRVRVLGEFPKGGDLQFIPTTLAEGATRRYYDESAYNFAPLILGVDVADYGGDKSVVYLRQGLHARRLFVHQGADPTWLMTYAGIVARLWDEHSADAVLVDSTGVGAGVVSALRQMGRRPLGIAFSGSSTSEGFHNKRAECWGLMKDWLKDGWIPKDDRLKDDLCAPEYSYTSAGRVILERKEDMKKRGVASPDDADALALTFAEPILATKTRGAVGLVAGSDSYNTEKYDPFHKLKHHNKRRRRK